MIRRHPPRVEEVLFFIFFLPRQKFTSNPKILLFSFKPSFPPFASPPEVLATPLYLVVARLLLSPALFLFPDIFFTSARSSIRASLELGARTLFCFFLNYIQRGAGWNAGPLPVSAAEELRPDESEAFFSLNFPYVSFNVCIRKTSCTELRWTGELQLG